MDKELIWLIALVTAVMAGVLLIIGYGVYLILSAFVPLEWGVREMSAVGAMIMVILLLVAERK